MGFSHFFVDRPIFASVLSIILTLVGAISFRALPVTEFPEIAPPTVEVTATYRRRRRRRGVGYGGLADRAGDQRRRRHDLHGDAVHRRRRHEDLCGVQARHQYRPGPGAGTEPRLDRDPASAGGGSAHRRDGEEEVARPDDGDPSDFAGRHRSTRPIFPITPPSTSRMCSPASMASATPSCSAPAIIPCGSGSTPPRCSRAA